MRQVLNEDDDPSQERVRETSLRFRGWPRTLQTMRKALALLWVTAEGMGAVLTGYRTLRFGGFNRVRQLHLVMPPCRSWFSAFGLASRMMMADGVRPL